jgi:16S rRNA (guanine527-N7)-methyltransferase
MNKRLQQALSLLGDAGIPLSRQQQDACLEHLKQVRRWNDYVSLVSRGDLALLEERHLVDALRLVPHLHPCVAEGRTWVDLGSGGGFPAIPVKIALPELPLVMVERMAKKAGVLRNMVTALGLPDVNIINGVFPEACPLPDNVVVTARAIEKPELVHPAIADTLPPNGTFWSTTGDAVAFPPPHFEVTKITDPWTGTGLTRGTLHEITRLP